MTSAVVLLSGGLDSGTAAAMWRDAGHALELAVTADYGQRSAAAELRAARGQAERLGVAWRPVELGWLGDAARRAGSALVGAAELPAASPEAPGDDVSAAAVWVPARNVVLLAMAAAFAEAHGAKVVLAGFNAEEAATFADNSAAFGVAMTAALALGTRTRVRVESPTLALDKAAIAAEARRLGWSREAFWSCYGAGPVACGRCESCARSARAWAAAASGLR